MSKVKEPSVAGAFYPGNKIELISQLELFKTSSKNFYKTTSRAVIVPHAGYVFSGKLAYQGINLLDKNIENIFIFAPAHRMAFDGLAISSYTHWKTPMGEIEVNQEINKELEENFGATFNDDPMKEEHALEVQLPIIQSLFNGVKIIPILIGRTTPNEIEKIISEYYPNTKNGFVISSDLSHYLEDKDARQLDYQTASMIESGDINNFRYEMACGALGIAGLVQFSNTNKYSLIRIGMHNSSSTNNDKSRVVGYGSWFLYEGDKNELIKKYHSDFVIGLCKTILDISFNNREITVEYPQVFNQLGASFVTLEKDEQLRGCIGSIIARRPLIQDLIENTKNSAFRDTRFMPVKEEELKQIKINVSILTEPRKMTFSSEEDLLNQIRENIDGIIIKDGENQAVYLPSVWDLIPDKREFLNSLKVKAGMNADHFSDTFEAYRYETVYIKEE